MNSANATAFETDVLVVGAGPTGLMLANQLARRGIRPRRRNIPNISRQMAIRKCVFEESAIAFSKDAVQVTGRSSGTAGKAGMARDEIGDGGDLDAFCTREFDNRPAPGVFARLFDGRRGPQDFTP